MNWSYPPQLRISYKGRIYLSEIRRPIPAQPNFHTLYKSEQCSLKHELFSGFLVSYERWVYELCIHINFSPRNHIFVFIWQPFQKCKVFFGTHGRAKYPSNHGFSFHIKTMTGGVTIVAFTICIGMNYYVIMYICMHWKWPKVSEIIWWRTLFQRSLQEN